MSRNGYLAAKDQLDAITRERSAQTRLSYELNPKKCLNCSTPILYEKRFDNKFCSRSCAAKYNNKNRAAIRFCAFCRKEITARNADRFCSNRCHKDYQLERNIKRWLDGEDTGNRSEDNSLKLAPFVRRWCLNRAGHKCEQCGWNEINHKTGKCPINVHHIDGDPYHTRPENLKVLCPNCHSLTPTYGVHGKGRRNRHKKQVV